MEDDANKSCSFAAWSLKSLFDYKGERGKNITVQCKLCKPREKILSTSKSSTSNLKKHLVRKHSSVYEGQLLETGPASRPLDTAGQSGASMDRLGEPAAESSCEAEEERPAKQAKNSYYINKASQRRLNALVFSFIVDSVQPFSVLELPSFLRLLDGLHTSRGLMTHKALVGKVWWAFHSMTETLSSRMKEARRVCTTADLWNAGGRSYLAVTCHWIQERTLERKSAALACAVLQAPPTCHALVAKLREVHVRFDLLDKLGRVVTDSGSAFVPVFSDFGFARDGGGGVGGGFDGEWERKGVGVGEGGVAFEDVSELLQSDVKEVQFLVPAHQRCPAHELSRLAQEEVQRTVGSGPSGGLYRGSVAKCAAIWGLAHGPSSVPPFLEELGAMQERVPRAALWSAEYRVVRKVLSLGDGEAQAACEQLGAEPLSAQEVLFLQEYVDVLQPLAYSLDFVQGERKCMLGYLLPTLLTLKTKLSEIRPFVRFSAQLIDALLAGIDARFAGILASREAKMAAVTVPKLRLWWLSPEEREEARAMLLEEAAAEERSQEVQEGGESDSDSEAEAKFFGFTEEEGETRSTAEVEVLNYLQDADKALTSLNKYPSIRRLFLKYNTTLPAGGANVQRLFSHNGHILTPQHTGIAEEHFEQVLLLRYNQDLCPLTNEGWHWS
ncbi:hypothetical protein SKAU_G00235830 [Synaphobranchus kaupii]|uniref:BED-type domain-containing protein n=1 Tax=Synaphobranchus kaupii TaxID=118154 RepID=A0A9Q1ITD9_SYNKA|nr:hypothetical protein SKAU_G00235830 [Synaphobranchus kaupii]